MKLSHQTDALLLNAKQELCKTFCVLFRKEMCNLHNFRKHSAVYKDRDLYVFLHVTMKVLFYDDADIQNYEYVYKTTVIPFV